MVQQPLRTVETLRGPSASDIVFDELYWRIIRVQLPPGARLSEADVARQMGVSRQPVRDAFYRLSQIGLLRIQPQRATTVPRVTEEAVMQARFIRAALEMETARAAAETADAAALAGLEDILARQKEAAGRDDRTRFHSLDDEFHREICASSGHEFAWGLIRLNKGQMDRVRYLSLSFGAPSAIADHERILDALKARDPERAASEMRVHLSRIVEMIGRIRAEHPAIFAESAP